MLQSHRVDFILPVEVGFPSSKMVFGSDQWDERKFLIENSVPFDQLYLCLHGDFNCRYDDNHISSGARNDLHPRSRYRGCSHAVFPADFSLLVRLMAVAFISVVFELFCMSSVYQQSLFDPLRGAGKLIFPNLSCPWIPLRSFALVKISSRVSIESEKDK